MADIKEKILAAAEKNLKALGNALGKTVGEALEADNANLATNLYLQLTDVKDSFTRIYGKLKDIPDEVYTEIAKTLIGEIDSIIFAQYSSDKTELVKQIATQIGKLFTKIPNQEVTVDGTTYKISFKGSRLGLKGKFIRVSDGDKESWLNWKSESYGKKILAQYVISLFNLDKYLSGDTLSSFITLVDSNGYELFSAILKNDTTQSALKKILGSKLFKAIGGENLQTKLEETLLSVSDDKVRNALTTYVELNTAYNNLVAELDSGDIDSLSEAFTNAATTLQSSLKTLGVTVNLETLPTDSIELTYNKSNTEVTIPAGYTGELKTADYKSSVKKIYAGDLTEDIIINGNAKANSIYGGKGNDTLIGGKGNDTLIGGNGADFFVYNSGDGRDVIADFTAGEDKIYLASGSVDKATASGKNITFKVGSGSIKVQNAKDKEITIALSDGSEQKYLNGSRISDDGSTLIVTNSDKSTVTIGAAIENVDASARTTAIKITGNGSANSIIGGSKNDSLYGSAGNDTLKGGKGNDKLWGGDGADTFIYEYGDGKDTIFGFDDNDTLTLDGLDFTASYKNKAVTLKFDDGGYVMLKNFTATTFHVDSDTYKISGSEFKKQ